MTMSDSRPTGGSLDEYPGEPSADLWEFKLYVAGHTPRSVTAIAAGGWHSLALKADGSIVGWGDNGFGQIDVPGATNFVAIAAGRQTNDLSLWFDRATQSTAPVGPLGGSNAPAPAPEPTDEPASDPCE